MKPNIFLCLALVLSGGLFGCSNCAQKPAAFNAAKQKSDSSGLTCNIFLPSLKPNSNGMLQATYILRNDGSRPIRICTLGDPGRSVGPGARFDITVKSGYFFSFAPAKDEFYKGVTTLKPSESWQWPFEIIAGTNATLNITAHFCSYTNFIPERLNCWYGEIDAKPFTIKVER